MCVCVRRQLHSEQATDYSFSTDTSKGTVRHCDDTSRQRVINWYVLKRLFLDEVQQQQNSPKMLPSTRYQRHLFESTWLTPPKETVRILLNHALRADWLMIAFITWNGNLVPLLEGLYSSNPCRFKSSDFWFLLESNRRPRNWQFRALTNWASFTSSHMNNSGLNILKKTELLVSLEIFNDSCIREQGKSGRIRQPFYCT